MDSSEDLPLSSNYDQFEVDHYSLDLHCCLRRRIFTGEVTLQVSRGTKWNGESVIILDCSDIEVQSVESLDAAPSEDVGSNVPERTKLEYSVSSWSVKIFLPSTKLADGRLTVKIHYRTRPLSRSLHWRLDTEGNVCVYTAAASINNRGLFPCQDIPKALSTWSARISLKSEDEDFDVFCTGETEAEVQQSGELRHYLSHHNSFPLPMSTFAIAVGRWSVRTIDCGQPRTRFIGPKSLVEKNFAAVTRYLACCLSAAEDLLGRYPLPRLDVVVVHRSFSGLGLASPHLLFLSPSLFAGDESLFIKISHEVSHAWFGIMIGSLDWTEAWISEGFATFLEEIIHDAALVVLGQEQPASLAPLRAQLKLESLQEEVNNTADDLQMLQPMSGRDSVKDGQQFVRNGLNPVAGLTQAHYLKGYFLLHHLMQTSQSRAEFFTLMKDYISRYSGQLVNSSHFIEMYYEKFQDSTTPQAELVQTWLHSPGVPTSHIDNLLIIKDLRSNDLYIDVLESFKEIKDLILKMKKKKVKECYLEQVLRYPDQVSLLFNYLLSLPSLPSRVLEEVRGQYGDFINTNCDIGHKWAELVIKNKFQKDFKFISDYLANNQSMGVYLYGELLSSKNARLRRIFDELWELLEGELDCNSKSIIQSMK